ncbi:hypothetical protein [Xanthomonas arboricola]|uniref:hypothetical protein n=1 Tax=Xanthomonas arboricola TaxID=56448 RepID=UPI0011B05706|nr:hypothetical protein [Xanthomonas arboricola]
MESKTTKRALSIRLPTDLMTRYSALIEGAGLTVSENVRTYVQTLMEKDTELEKDKFKVKVSINWRDLKPGDPYPESIGAVMVEVFPPTGMTIEQLDSLIFSLPEFMDGNHEPYRIDSYYFHRIASSRSFIESGLRKRNVISFSMMGGRWHGGIFRYEDSIPLNVIASEVAGALGKGIRATIRCAQLGILPEQRISTDAELVDRKQYFSNIKFPEKESFKLVAEY